MENPEFLDPNPHFSTAEVSSSHIDEPFMWLASRVIDSVIIDGHRLISVDHVDRLQDGNMHVVCTSDTGSSHMFEFNPLEDGIVNHFFVTDSSQG